MSYTALRAAGLYLLLGIIWLGSYRGIWLFLSAQLPQVSPALLEYLLHAVFITVSAVFIYVLARTYPGNQHEYRQLFYGHPVPMWIYDWKTLRFLAVNEAAVQKYGYSEEEFLRMTILHIRDPATIQQVLDDVKGTRQDLTYRGIWQHRKKNREAFPVEIYSHSTRYAGRDARLVMAVDIEAEIRSTIIAKDIGTRYDLLARVTQDSIYYWDMQSGQVTRNHGPSSMFGYKEEDIREESSWWMERVHPDDAADVMVSFREAAAGRQPNWEAEYRFRCADGSYKYVHDRGHIVYNEKQDAVRVIGVIQDITERKRFIQQLQHQNDVLREIARINSHEIRKPVASILGIIAVIDLKNETSLNTELFGMLKESTCELDAVLFKIRDKLKQLRDNHSPE
ncbi:PAS domain-containing protein [Chitinophaga cymbidii]|uniref:histidine kinase n=1 Tax=Chitinophaga cymbidii TaxID=1096750 RepID=A0A512RIB8_9BACT|nr:PAS domain-containing protein [Chitinophaga cymbidii]GEP95437.1 hypothetical protein CCY01nite_16970 [Chitinophaga cymbidii]